jgi:hypothetical protein
MLVPFSGLQASIIPLAPTHYPLSNRPIFPECKFGFIIRQCETLQCFLSLLERTSTSAGAWMTWLPILPLPFNICPVLPTFKHHLFHVCRIPFSPLSCALW